MNPERFAMNSIDSKREHRLELSPLMERAYQKANEEVLSNPDYVIQESEFSEGEHPVYDPKAVATDIALADRLQKEFAAKNDTHERTSKKIADTLEAVVLMQSEMSNWFGNATTQKTSRYDDYVNKVDMIAEWAVPNSGSQVLALAVDVTFGKSNIEKKMAGVKEEIERGKLGSIRYFKDSQGDFMGTRRNVPRTIIGVSQPVVEELAHLWLEKENKALAQHPIQRLFIDQMATQLRMMQEYAAKRGRPMVAQAYQNTLSTLQSLQLEKTAFPIGNLSHDPVFQEIMDQTRSQFK
jgi:hypothetical protein